MSAALSFERLRSARPRWVLARPVCLALGGGWTGYWTWTFILGGPLLARTPDPWHNAALGADATAPMPAWPIVVAMATAGALAGLMMHGRQGRQTVATVFASLTLLILVVPAASVILALADAWSTAAAWSRIPAALGLGVVQGLAVAPWLVLNPVSVVVSVVLGLVASFVADVLETGSYPASVRSRSVASVGSQPDRPARYEGRAIGLALAGAALAQFAWAAAAPSSSDLSAAVPNVIVA